MLKARLFATSLALLLLAACATGAPAVYDDTPAKPTRIAANPTATAQPTLPPPTVQPTVQPVRVTVEPTPKALSAASKRNGDPANGKKLFHTFQPKAGIACATCHRVDSEARLVGPGLMNVGERAAHRIKGLNAELYLYQSITRPEAYVVEGYPNIMTRNFDKVFTEAEIHDIIAYLFTLRDGTKVAEAP